MPFIEDQSYIKQCAELASYLSISLAAARRKVELAVTRNGQKDLSSKQAMVQKLLAEARSNENDDSKKVSVQLDQLLKALGKEDDFMIED